MAPDRRKADDPGPGQRRSGSKATHIPGALLATVVFAAALYLRKADLGPRLAERLDLQKWLGSCTGHRADGRLQEANSPLQQVYDAIGVGMCQLSGNIHDCSCDYASVERMNRERINPLLRELVQQPFFRYFKVNLYCDCPFWPDDGMCMLRDCSVCECDEAEVPPLWQTSAEGHQNGTASCDGVAALESESAVDRSVDPATKATLVNIPGWRGWNNPWMVEDENDIEFSYINLVKNPERYTGYKGEHAHRIWNLIYSQSCFANISTADECTEQRIFYRLISGMHASISAHIAQDYLIDEELGKWGPNVKLFKERLGTPDVRERVENLYFTYLFVLRAVLKAGPLLRQAPFETGFARADSQTAALVQELVGSEELKEACPVPFDEGRLWKDDDADVLKAQLQTHFHNITKAMDCVGCEKCKLWGKLQLLGIATSLKILFSTEDCLGTMPDTALILERNEVIALMNLLERLSSSIEVVRKMSMELVGSGERHDAGLGAIQDVTHQRLIDIL